MKFKELVFCLIVIILLCQCKVFQYEDTTSMTNRSDPMPHESGKCFAKCLITDISELQSEEYAIFTGDELEENVDVEVREVVIEKGQTKWVKKKADRNCLSSNPDDCLVWCLIEIPEVTEKMKILIDTTQSKNYEIRRIEYEVVVEKGGFTEWRSILCEDDVTVSIINQIQDSLREKKYYYSNNTEIIDTETKSSLTKFQRDNNLPVGQLDLETLDVLGITVID
jgi:hypothetical protein